MALSAAYVFFIGFGFYCDAKQSGYQLTSSKGVSNSASSRMKRPKRQKTGPFSPRNSAKIQPCPESGLALANSQSQTRSFGDAFCTALKYSHVLISIWSRYDSALSRPKRLTLYLLRTFAMITIAVLFFQQLTVMNMGIIIPVSIFSLIFISPIQFFLEYLLSSPIKTTNRGRVINSDKHGDENTRQLIRNGFGYLAIILYLGLLFFLTFFFNAQAEINTMILNQSVLLSWGIQMILDLFIYSILKVCINYALIKMYEKSEGCSKQGLDYFIDQNIANVYGRD